MEVSRRCLKQYFPFTSDGVWYFPSALCDTFFFFSQPTGVLQLMEIGDVQKKDIMDHPENYTLLTTLDEGLSHFAFIFLSRQQLCDDCSLRFRDVEKI